MRLLCRKYHFLENSKNRILVKKLFLAKQKNMCLLLIKNRKKIISFKSTTSTVNLIWNDPYIVRFRKSILRIKGGECSSGALSPFLFYFTYGHMTEYFPSAKVRLGKFQGFPVSKEIKRGNEESLVMGFSFYVRH